MTGCASLAPPGLNNPLPAVPPPATPNGTTVVVNGEQCCPPTTLWQFLGVPQIIGGVRTLGGRLINRNGNFPGLEPTTSPLRALGDPENLNSENPAVRAAAEQKQQQDAAAQQVKALKFLGETGCACDPSIGKALLAALDDCDESVRYGAAKAYTASANLGCCKCNSKSCCSKEALDKLAELAYAKDDHGCFKEPSAKVRSAARQAFHACQCKCLPVPEDEEEETPGEGQSLEGQTAQRAYQLNDGSVFYLPGFDFSDDDVLAQQGRARLARREQELAAQPPVVQSEIMHSGYTPPTYGAAYVQQQGFTQALRGRGQVVAADVPRNVLFLQFETPLPPAAAQQPIEIYHRQGGCWELAGHLRVVEFLPNGQIAAVPDGQLHASAVQQNAEVFFEVPGGGVAPAGHTQRQHQHGADCGCR